MSALRIAFVTALVMIVVSTVPGFERANEAVEGDAIPSAAANVSATAEPTPTPSATATSTPVATGSAAPARVLPAGTPEARAASAAGTAAGATIQGAGTAAVGRLAIPRIGVSAAIVVLPLREDETMPAPAGPLEVATYAFAAAPGEAGNFVVAGHVDFANYGAAVFYRLRELRPGDEVAATTGDGRVFVYRVSSVAAYEEATAPVAEILGPTAMATMTLITCTGTFSQQAHAYDQRLVVRAERVE